MSHIISPLVPAEKAHTIVLYYRNHASRYPERQRGSTGLPKCRTGDTREAPIIILDDGKANHAVIIGDSPKISIDAQASRSRVKKRRLPVKGEDALNISKGSPLYTSSWLTITFRFLDWRSKGYKRAQKEGEKVPPGSGMCLL